MKKLIENWKLRIALLLGGLKYSIEKLLNKNYFGLIAVFVAVVGGFIAEWIAWVWLMLYFILWSNFANLKKKKLTK